MTYGMSVGTSFAAPAVAGAAAVVRKWYYNLTSLLPSPALVKAILINGARDLGGPWAVPPNCGVAAMVRDQTFTPTACVGRIPDQYQGWGMLNLERLLGPATNYYFRDQFVGPILTPSSTYWETPVTVNDSTRPIRITLAYTDAPGSANLSPYPVKNILTVSAYQVVCSPCWYANLFDSSTGWSVPNVVTHDEKNNGKQIIIPPGSYGNGTVIRVFVLAENITEDAVYLSGGSNPQQDFALFIENAR